VSDTVHPQTGQPVGPPVDATPAARPGPATLQGRFGRVEKLTEAHAASLWDALKGHDQIWTYLPMVGPFADAAAFAAWAASCTTLEDPCFYAILDAGGRVLGVFALMAIRPEHRVIEVGYVTYAPALQRTPLATEAQYLLARHVFETLGYRRYEWKCDSLNAPSWRAAERLGFIYEGTFRKATHYKGRNRDTAWFAIVDDDWPGIRAAFEDWLVEDNFDADGRQKRPLRTHGERR